MRITKEQLEELGAWDKDVEWFMRRFPFGDADFQSALNALAEDELPAFAEWLIGEAGPDPVAAIEVESIDAKNFFAAGQLVVKEDATVSGSILVGRSLKVGKGIKAGDDIAAGEDIEAGGDIEAGFCIRAGGQIKAGEGFGIYAGSSWLADGQPTFSCVIAKTKPDRLMHGHWLETKTTEVAA